MGYIKRAISELEEQIENIEVAIEDWKNGDHLKLMSEIMIRELEQEKLALCNELYSISDGGY